MADPDGFHGGEGFGQLEGLADEDFKEAGKSSAPTEEGKQIKTQIK